MKQIYFLFGCIFLFASLTANAQNVVTGTVYDGDTKDVLPGVSVVIKGTTSGDYTNSDGKFTVKPNTLPVTIVLSFLGFETTEIEVTSAQDLRIELAAAPM